MGIYFLGECSSTSSTRGFGKTASRKGNGYCDEATTTITVAITFTCIFLYWLLRGWSRIAVVVAAEWWSCQKICWPQAACGRMMGTFMQQLVPHFIRYLMQVSSVLTCARRQLVRRDKRRKELWFDHLGFLAERNRVLQGLFDKIPSRQKELVLGIFKDFVRDQYHQQRIRLFLFELFKNRPSAFVRPQPVFIVVDQAEELLRRYRTEALLNFRDWARECRETDCIVWCWYWSCWALACSH